MVQALRIGDERYTLSELPEAMRRVEEGRAVGKAVIVMEHDD